MYESCEDCKCNTCKFNYSMTGNTRCLDCEDCVDHNNHWEECSMSESIEDQ